MSTSDSSSSPSSNGETLDTRVALALDAGSVFAYEQDTTLTVTWAGPPTGPLGRLNLQGRTLPDGLPNRDEGRVLETLARRALEGQTVAQEEISITLAGTPHRYACTLAPRHNAAGSVVGVHGAVVDVTARAEREAALRRARREAEQARDDAEQARQEAERARAEAEAANRLKSVFLANASHALLTPLTGLLSLVDALRARNLPQITTPLARIRRSGERLRETISGLLDLSKLEAGGVIPDRRPTNLRLLVHEATELHRGHAEQENLTLSVTLPPPTTVYTDPEAIHRILGNLVSNAIKYTDDGTVSVEARVSNQDVTFVVDDTGPGIDEDFLPDLFDPFTQAAGSGLTREGTGLGMAITQRLVSALNGTIQVDTDSKRGTTFLVRLPREERG